MDRPGLLTTCGTEIVSVRAMKRLLRNTVVGLGLAAALTVTGSTATASAAPPPRPALPPLPSNCGWLPWYDLMSWWYGQAGYCFQDGYMIFFDWNGNYGTM